MALRSQSSQVAAQRRKITQSSVSFSSSSFSLNGSRLLGISISGVPVFVRCADSCQESGQNFPWEKSNFPETWQVQTLHTECAFPKSLLASDLTARSTLGMAGFCAWSFFQGSWHFSPFAWKALSGTCHYHWGLDMDTSMVLALENVWVKENMTDDLSASAAKTPHMLGTSEGKLWDHGFTTDPPCDLGQVPGTDFFHCQHEGLHPALCSSMEWPLGKLDSGGLLMYKREPEEQEGNDKLKGCCCSYRGRSCLAFGVLFPCKLIFLHASAM